MTKNDRATAAGLAAYVILLVVAYGVWRLTARWGWGIPDELLVIPAVVGALVIHPSAEWYRRVTAPAMGGVSQSNPPRSK